MIKIIRIEESEHGMIGVMTIFNNYFCCTLEPDHADNEPCIPAGEYTCQLVDSPKFGGVFEVLDVPGRTHILIHKGNVEGNTLGCILLGQYFGKLQGERAVLNSGNTFRKFMDFMTGYNKFKLEILEVI